MVLPTDTWKRYVPWVRVLFGCAAVAGALLMPLRTARWAAPAAGLFVLAAILIATRKRQHAGIFGPLVLFLDVIFFLVISGAGIGSIFWFPSICYLFLMIEAAALHPAREALIAIAVSVAFCALAPALNLAIRRDTALIGGVLACLWSLYKHSIQNRMQELAQQVVEFGEVARSAREVEAQRIASDFHDGPLQGFISLQMRLEILRKLLERDARAGMDDLLALQKLAQQQVKELRAFVRGMRPMELEGANLLASARRVCENFQKESGIPVTFIGGESSLKLPEETAAEIVQMLREALHNVLKHAAATRVAVSMEGLARMLEVSVDDNGRGFQFSGVYSLDELELLGLGPASLKRRARSLNAEMTLESRPGQGVGLKIRIPLP
jgi:signal transduction histidine kinase